MPPVSLTYLLIYLLNYWTAIIVTTSTPDLWSHSVTNAYQA